MTTIMPAKLKTVKSTGAVILLATVGFVAFSNPIVGIFCGIGLALSCLVKWNSSSVPTTKRRSLVNLWQTLGAYGILTLLLSSVSITLGFLVFHSLILWPVAVITLTACWAPFLVQLFRKGD